MAKLTDSEPYYRFLNSELKSSDIEVHSLAGDASARRYYRVNRGEESFVLMSWEPFQDEKQYPFVNVLYHLAKHDVHVPKVIAVCKEEGFILLEDLGDLTLERKFWESQSSEHAVEFYQKSMDEILKIHYPSTQDRDPQCVAFKIEFNTERLLWEMNYAREHLLEKFLHGKFDGKQSALMDKTFHNICERLHKEPKYLAHRDYHSRNLMIKTGKVRVIDFQDSRLGPIQYDLVSLLKDSYVTLDSKVAGVLLDYYLDRRKEFGEKPVSREQFDLIYELQSIQRCFKACGSFASFFNTRHDTRYLKYIRHTLQTVRRSLLVFPEYRELLDLFTDQGLFEKDIAAT